MGNAFLLIFYALNNEFVKIQRIKSNVKQVSTVNKCLVLLYGFQRGREHAEHFLFSDLTRKEEARFKQLVRNRRHFFILSIPLPFTLIISLSELV